jgi:hypothetical protein
MSPLSDCGTGPGVQGCQIFLGTIYQNGNSIPIDPKIYLIATKIPNGRKIDQTTIKYTNNNFHCKTLQNLPKLGFWFEYIQSGNPDQVCFAWFCLFCAQLGINLYLTDDRKIAAWQHSYKQSQCLCRQVGINCVRLFCLPIRFNSVTRFWVTFSAQIWQNSA